MTPRRGAAFTVLEVLITLALIGMLTAVLVGGATYMLRDVPATPEDVLWKAVGVSRKQALLTNRDVTLVYSPAEKDLPAAITAVSGKWMQTFPFEGMKEVQVDWLSLQKSRTAILVGGQLVETQRLAAVVVYNDGTCTPFRAQFRHGASVYTVQVDPWTCAPVILKGDEKR